MAKPSCWLLLLMSVLAAAAAAVGKQASGTARYIALPTEADVADDENVGRSALNIPPLTACDQGLANQRCCSRISEVLKANPETGRSSVCQYLKPRRHPELPLRCYKNHLCGIICSTCKCD